MIQRRKPFCFGDFFFRTIYTYCEELGITVNPTFLTGSVACCTGDLASIMPSCGWLSGAPTGGTTG